MHQLVDLPLSYEISGLICTMSVLVLYPVYLKFYIML